MIKGKVHISTSYGKSQVAMVVRRNCTKEGGKYQTGKLDLTPS